MAAHPRADVDGDLLRRRPLLVGQSHSSRDRRVLGRSRAPPSVVPAAPRGAEEEEMEAPSAPTAGKTPRAVAVAAPPQGNPCQAEVRLTTPGAPPRRKLPRSLPSSRTVWNPRRPGPLRSRAHAAARGGPPRRARARASSAPCPPPLASSRNRGSAQRSRQERTRPRDGLDRAKAGRRRRRRRHVLIGRPARVFGLHGGDQLACRSTVGWPRVTYGVLTGV